MERYLADAAPPVCSLNIANAFEALTPAEKLYSHHMSKACWSGARIIMAQTSPGAEGIFDLIIAAFSSASDPSKLADLEAHKARSELPEEEWKAVVSYSAQVLSNLANIKSFGGTKFIPRAASSSFEAVVRTAERASVAIPLWDAAKEGIYATEPEKLLSIGKPTEGHLSAYYPEVGFGYPTDAEVDEVQALCDQNGVSTLNTRLSKTSPTTLTLLVASSSTTLPSNYPSSLSMTNSQTLEIKGGDHAASLAKVSEALKVASEHAEDDNRSAMLADYVKSFETGDFDMHDQGGVKWVKDQGPVVETYIGFIENYVDPWASRAEFEGFVAVVNKEESKKFQALVDVAGTILLDLPWGKELEVEVFRQPVFSSLEILSFATGGIPAGINIPNSFWIREKIGFKNVSLSNILSAKAAGEKITFVAPEEVEDFERWESRAFGFQVASHELLGHGSGKLLQENKDGSFNFSRDAINPVTGKPFESWYKPGETYGSKIGPVSSSMEECRAEAVALYLASNKQAQEIFGFNTKEEQDNVVYYMFLVMARAGVRALEWYNPETKKHGQAHMEARLGITNWLITHGLAKIEEVREGGELVDAFVRLDRDAVLSRGKEVMGKLLVEIQVRKSTGDGPGATSFYKKLTTPDDQWVKELRPLVLSKKLPRKIFVQPNTIVVDGEVQLVEYPVTVEGTIESFVARQL